MPENEIDDTMMDRVRDAQQLGFVTALHGAGIQDDDVHTLYNLYEQQRASREDTLESAYNAIVGRE
jgi:hypothetical protein